MLLWRSGKMARLMRIVSTTIAAGSVLVVQPGTALQLSNRGDDELRLFIYGAPPERGEATFLPTIE